MPAAIPSNPRTMGTTPEVTNMTENASVPMDQKIIANENLENLV